MCAMPLAAPPLRTNPIFCCVKPVKKENKRMITDPIFTFSKGISFSKKGAVNNALKNQIEKFYREVTIIDRKSTRLNSSHTVISYAVFCLKKKKKKKRREKL